MCPPLLWPRSYHPLTDTVVTPATCLTLAQLLKERDNTLLTRTLERDLYLLPGPPISVFIPGLFQK